MVDRADGNIGAVVSFQRHAGIEGFAQRLARLATLDEQFKVQRVLTQEVTEMRADPYGEGLAQTWYMPGAGGDWRPIGTDAYDAQGLWGSDVRVWYRTRFGVPSGVSPERWRLSFRVLNTSADLFLNGRSIGQQVLGEASFQEPELDGEGNLVTARAATGNGPFIYDIGRQVQSGTTNEFVVQIWGYTDRGVICQKPWLLEARQTP